MSATESLPYLEAAFHPIAIEPQLTSYHLLDEFYPLEPLQQEALSEGFRLQHSTHDMFYFVLARRMAATLMTADRRLMELCTCNGVDCIEEAKVELNEERKLGQFAQREPQCDPRHSSQR